MRLEIVNLKDSFGCSAKCEVDYQSLIPLWPKLRSGGRKQLNPRTWVFNVAAHVLHLQYGVWPDYTVDATQKRLIERSTYFSIIQTDTTSPATAASIGPAVNSKVPFVRTAVTDSEVVLRAETLGT